MAHSQVADSEFREVVRQILLRIAIHEDELACAEATSVPYWSPTPSTVQGHRVAAFALRQDEDSVREGPLPGIRAAS